MGVILKVIVVKSTITNIVDFIWCTPKLLNGLNCESKGDNNGKKRSWGMFLVL